MTAPTLVDSELSTTDVTLTGSLFTGDLAVVVVVGWNGTAGSNVPTLTVSGNSLTWTKRERAGVNSNKDVYCCIAHAAVGSDISASILCDLTNSSNHACLLYRIPGGAYVQHQSGTGDTFTSNPTTFTITMPGAVSSANGILQVFGIAEAFDGQILIAPASGWTELHGNEDGTLVDLSYQTAWREASTSTAVSTTFDKDEYVEVMVAVEFSLPAAGTNITASTVEVLTELPVPTITASASVTASVVEIVSELPVPTITATADIAAATVEVVVELPAVTVDQTVQISPSPVEAVVELPAATITASADVTASTVEIVAELPSASIDTGTIISPDPVETVVELPTPTLTASSDLTASTVDVVVELPTPTIDTTADASPAPDPVTIMVELPSPDIQTAMPNVDITASTVTIVVELPTPTIGGDAVAGQLPMWRIGGYPSPSRIAPATGPRSLANR